MKDPPRILESALLLQNGLPEYILSEDVRTRNDCEDERETEEEKGVAVEIPPV